MKRFWSCILLGCALSASAQTITDSLLVDGHYRTFRYQLPKSSLSQGSLLFVMHGSGGSGQDMIAPAARLQAIAERERLMLVYPDGYKRYWNECRKFATSAANKENINEEAFFSAMILYFQARFNIDPRQVYAAGFSGGGQMAYKLGMVMPNRIRAIGAIVANLPDSMSCDCAPAQKALSVMIVNGTADKVNPDAGGEMFVNNSSYGRVMSSAESFAYWAKLAGYQGRPKIQQLPDSDTTDGCTITQYMYRFKERPTITRLQVNNGGHSFPNDIDVFLFFWDFCKREWMMRTP